MKRREKKNVSKTSISFGRSKSMAIDSVNRFIDENNRISDVFPRICRREISNEKRKNLVEKYNVCMVARYCSRRNIGRATYNLGAIGKTIRYDFVYRIGSDVLLCLLLGILLGSIGTNTRNWVSMATTRN
jgi:hypothetical protein